ncbi:QacE family quaternary ammonium compound efflux SMR transporter [Paenibacillus sambharensis]|uniref:QacE family quaternary ammonium compound efflux SMR transporter n=1 Tax=Paenibacillus sambharensis TaxID=1803190 RepID=A0A2W1LGE5_9BACL|nr:multidrug efflux SMR transporter [Paenibacillus sambharensis]PZD97759.1 QacE family quaternary ammonium compound efflux SMR transporter [Paenibacillus sambharensis]
MAWIYLLISGLGEVSGVTFLKLSDGFRKWKPAIGAVLSGFVSFYFLSRALQDIPISTAYGIWTGIGSAGSVILGMLVFKESKAALKLLFIAMIIAGVAGLRIVGGVHG